jgi:hypothetical protein
VGRNPATDRKEKQDWQQGKQILQSRTDAVNGEIAVLKERLNETRRASAEANGKKAGEVAENEALQRAGSALASWVGELESGVKTLQARLPEPLLQKVKPLYDRMPTDSATTNVSLAERYQNVVGILNEVGKFNNDITMVTEVRTLSDGKPAEVRTFTSRPRPTSSAQGARSAVPVSRADVVGRQ